MPVLSAAAGTADQARTDGSFTIPGITLADEVTPDPMPFAHDAWAAWYARVLAHRIRVQQQVSQPGERGARARAVQKALCQQRGGLGKLYWINTFAFIAEPRGGSAAVERILPAVLWPRQLELQLTIDEAMASPPGPLGNLAGPKTRACGATWMDAYDHAWRWLFEPFYTGLLISETEDKVDRPGDPDSWMWKIDFALGRQLREMGNRYPTWLLPAGFAWERARGKERQHLMLTNPETGGNIAGVATTENAGRAGRRQKASIDEGGFNDFFDEIYNLLQSTTDHTLVWSSASMHPPGFYNLVHGKDGYAAPRVFWFRWNQIPGHDDAWLTNQRARMKQEDFEREILIRFKAGTGVHIYPEAMEVGTGWHPYEPGIGPLIGSIDDGGTDGTALVVWQRESGTPYVRVVGAHYVTGYLIHQIGGLITGELDNSRRWTRRDIEWAAWAARIGLKHARWVGDRHGNQTNQVTGTSPFQEITNSVGVYIATADSPQENAIEHRQDCLKGVIPYLHVHETNGAPDFLEAVQDRHLPRRRGAVQPTRLSVAPVHDEGSHLVTAGEYYAIHYPAHRIQPRRGPLPPNIGDQPPAAPPTDRYTRRPPVMPPPQWPPQPAPPSRGGN